MKPTLGERRVVMLKPGGEVSWWDSQERTCVDVVSDPDQDDSHAIILHGNYEIDRGGTQLPDIFIVECVELKLFSDEIDADEDDFEYHWKVVEAEAV
jgi:hypothetical protein